jgi:16S rRNA pseudouridine516 synthase
LDRYLSQATGLSRSMAQRAVRRGAVTVAGVVIRDPATAVAAGAAVTLDGVSLALPGKRYFMLHKPPGVVCDRGDAHHRSVFELLHEPGRDRLHVAGRLDQDVTGLVLITDDGAWSHRITAPRRKQPKTYLVTLAAPLDEPAAAALRGGVSLRGESRPTRPAAVQPLADRRARLTIREGRYHQVKRMFAAVGNRVVALHREGIGALALDPALPPGAYRHLSPAELELLGG